MEREGKSAGIGGGIVLLTLGIALFGGSFVLEIDGLRAAGIGLGVVGLVLLLASSRRRRDSRD